MFTSVIFELLTWNFKPIKNFTTTFRSFGMRISNFDDIHKCKNRCKISSRSPHFTCHDFASSRKIDSKKMNEYHEFTTYGKIQMTWKVISVLITYARFKCSKNFDEKIVHSPVRRIRKIHSCFNAMRLKKQQIIASNSIRIITGLH